MLFRDGRLRLHSTLVASKASLRALNNSGHYGSQEPGWYLRFAVNNYEAAFTCWSCSALLDSLEKHMSRLRDVSRTLVASRRCTRVLNKLRHELIDEIDIAVIGSELHAFAKKDGWFEH